MSTQVIPFPDRLVATEIQRSIRRLQASGIDGILPLGDLIKRCRNPQHKIEKSEEATLKSYKLMQPDGTISDIVKSVVLSGTAGGNFFG